MTLLHRLSIVIVGFVVAMFAAAPTFAQAPGKQPNIVVIMGDDIGWANIGAYHQGLWRAGRRTSTSWLQRECASPTTTPRRVARRDVPTSSPANCRSAPGMTTVGQAGSPIGIPAQAVTIATVLKSMGYATGQFGKNHLGDLNAFLPTVHGFDEFFGYLYHLDAMEDPCHPNYPQDASSDSRSAQHGSFVGDQRRRHHGSIRAGARSASRRSRTPANSVRSGWKPWTTRSATSR